jgi:hypothetical protein
MKKYLVPLIGLAMFVAVPLVSFAAATGVTGVMMIGPTCPVPTPKDPCGDVPYEGIVLVKASDGQIVGKLSANEDGEFQMFLPPGNYQLVSTTDNEVPPYLLTQGFNVTRFGLSSIVIQFDSGIR